MKHVLTLALVGLVSSTAFAADKPETDSVVRRYSAAAIDETPDFRRHVVPLLGKLGCNGRACHGSFQGRGGFRLSLFGYDFKADHEALSDRLDTDSPADSLMIEKPTMKDPHEGGRRFAENSWQHKLLLRWIETGAKPVPEKAADLVRLEVSPAEVLFRRDGQKSQLKAVAVWSDGTREDVTPLSRFKSNDDQVADVTKDGMVLAGSPGDSHVVVSYDRAVVPIPVIRPVSDQYGRDYPIAAARTKVDQLVIGKLQKLGIVPSETCSDAEFLRRVSLDITGTLPAPAEVEEFLADTSSDKRARKIDELLERPGYVAWWTTKLCDFTGNSDDALNNVTPVQGRASKDWYDWIYRRVEQNAPYDTLVKGLVTATSREEGESYEEFCSTMSRIYGNNPEGSFADRESMPHYWARRTFRRPEERAIGFAYTFLGTRIQCAQCHKHPFDEWTQDDFKQFQNIFTRTQFGRSPQTRQEYDKMMAALDTGKLRGGELRRKIGELLRKGETVPFQEVYATAPRPTPKKPDFSRIKDPAARKRAMQRFRAAQKRRRGGGAASGKLLGGDVLNLNEYADPREPLMEWLRGDPKFAKAFVNRVWANYFNRGIVDPPDDMSLANPPVNAELLDHLATGFVDSGFDMKWLHREITNSDTYQRSWRANDTNRLDERNFSRAVPRRLPAEIAVDAIAQATSADTKVKQFAASNDGRMIAIPGAGRRMRTNRDAAYALTIFGRSIRESNCDCDRSMEPSLLQTVFLRNDQQTLALIDGRDSWLSQLAKEAGIAFVPKAQPGRVNPQVAKRIRQQIAATQKKIRNLRDRDGTERQVAKLRKQLRSLQQRIGAQPSRDEQSEEELAEQKTRVDYDQVVSSAYLRTLSRYPTEDEKQVALAHLNDAPNVVAGARDLLWALLNTKEFIVNH